MSFPRDFDSVDALFASRGAHLYWKNWTDLNVWYRSYMMPEMLKAQQEMAKECKRESRRWRKLRRKKRSKKLEDLWHKGMKVDIEEDDRDIENTLEDMSPEYLEFHQKTLKHRDELRKLKELQSEQDAVIEYIADDQGPEEKPMPSTAPPESRPGIARMEELDRLYGSSATRIHMIETQMQAKFDEFRTKNQPRLWPVIPLSL